MNYIINNELRNTGIFKKLNNNTIKNINDNLIIIEPENKIFKLEEYMVFTVILEGYVNFNFFNKNKFQTMPYTKGTIFLYLYNNPHIYLTLTKNNQIAYLPASIFLNLFNTNDDLKRALFHKWD